MNPAFPISRLAILGLVALTTATAWSQSLWKWRDAQGQLQISDRAPPPDVPQANILQRPANLRMSMVPTAPAPAASAASGANPRVDSELEARKRKLEQQQAAAKKAAEQQQADAATQRKTQNVEECNRMRNYLTAVEGGQRISRFNSKGEREVLDDQARVEEAKRIRNQMAASCQP